MKNAEDGVILSNQERLELAAVKAGLKPVQRLERTAIDAQKLAKDLIDQGLVFVAAEFQVIQHRSHPLGDEFMRIIPGRATGSQLGIYYVALQAQADAARSLARLEFSNPGSPEIGQRLGYPSCCVAAYQEIQRGRDWLESMLDRTSENEPGLVACNRLARLFGGWTLLPDYFPCSFACSPSADWCNNIVSSVSDVSLQEFVASARVALELPIRIEENTITQLTPSPQIVFHNTGIIRSRTLTWLRHS
jgi:hypothetical protein